MDFHHLARQGRKPHLTGPVSQIPVGWKMSEVRAFTGSVEILVSVETGRLVGIEKKKFDRVAYRLPNILRFSL